MTRHEHAIYHGRAGVEDESPGYGCYVTDDFGVHQVAQTDESGCGRGGNAYHVEHGHELHFIPMAVEKQRQEETGGATVAGQSGIACVDPVPTLGGKLYGNENLYNVLERRKVVGRVVEDAVSQSRSKQYAYEAVKEQWVELAVVLRYAVFVGYGVYALSAVEVLNNEVCQQNAYNPTERIEAYGESTDVEKLQGGLPIDIE